MNIQKKAWLLKYRLLVLAAMFRGFCLRLTGRVEGSVDLSTFLIGPTNMSFIDQSARLILGDVLAGRPANAPVDFNSHLYSLGVLNPMRYQNPPSRLSRFRIECGAVVRLFMHSKVGPGFYFSVGERAELSIGSWTYVGSDFEVYCRREVKIGNRCMISHRVTVMDYDGHRIYKSGGADARTVDQNVGVDIGKSESVVIEDNVWIGANAAILKGVHVGRGAVIASGSVVVNDVPPNTLVAGNPAAVTKEEVVWNHF